MPKLIPDGKPFAIRDGNRWRFILGKEIDRGTEPLSTGQARRSIRQKFEHYFELTAGTIHIKEGAAPKIERPQMAGRPVKTSAGITGPSAVAGACARRADHDL